MEHDQLRAQGARHTPPSLSRAGLRNLSAGWPLGALVGSGGPSGGSFWETSGDALNLGQQKGGAEEVVLAGDVGETFGDSTEKADADPEGTLVDHQVSLVEVVFYSVAIPAPQASHGAW